MYYFLRHRVEKLEKEVEELKKIIKEKLEKEDENIVLETRGNDIIASTD